jgi:hypothetical protein
VKSSSFNFRNDQSFLDLAPSVQVIPECVPADVKLLLKKHSSILRTEDVMPKPTHGVEHHIHTGSHPLFLQKPAAFIHKNLKLPKRNSKS